ncbi:Panacea domain-containing protein [Kiloniella sp. b19]|uniref:Panacea domain-containing protein n=1 Tax=Kiloniella sp. GXU_MW_B19 TaxID=3141326 RepID=UPI0031D81712
MTQTAEFTPAQIANFFLDKGKNEGIAIENLKLQKLVYIAYGWSLAVLDIKLFDEPIEAWKHGPVIPSLFHEFKHFRKAPITQSALDIDWSDLEGRLKPAQINITDEKQAVVLNKVWDVYKIFTGWELRARTHEQDTPWTRVYAPDENHHIRDEDVREHFVQKINDLIEAAHAA